ncbi:MAG: class I SAM-dependent methyltransferase [Bryobacterales bacterium]|nr:class I SAM-dependent methyltransferase [Bryobacterales bacterium]
MAGLSTKELQSALRSCPSLHSAGTFSTRAFDGIARHASKRRIRCSAETGSGATTLLMSHLSEHHWVFALDDGNGSVANVKQSSLLRADHVEFVEGPTQCTLPRFHFTEKLQFALIDGPHAYPFPDLEYYYLYPHLELDSLLVIDDIHIRSVQNLFRFLCSDRMFRLEEVIGSTAIFSRTAAPVFDPHGDGWWLQGYNRKLLSRYTWKETVRNLLPGRMRRLASHYRYHWGRGRRRWQIVITSPGDREMAGGAGEVTRGHGICRSAGAFPPLGSCAA